MPPERSFKAPPTGPKALVGQANWHGHHRGGPGLGGGGRGQHPFPPQAPSAGVQALAWGPGNPIHHTQAYPEASSVYGPGYAMNGMPGATPVWGASSFAPQASSFAQPPPPSSPPPPPPPPPPVEQPPQPAWKNPSGGWMIPDGAKAARAPSPPPPPNLDSMQPPPPPPPSSPPPPPPPPSDPIADRKKIINLAVNKPETSIPAGFLPATQTKHLPSRFLRPSPPPELLFVPPAPPSLAPARQLSKEQGTSSQIHTNGSFSEAARAPLPAAAHATAAVTSDASWSSSRPDSARLIPQLQEQPVRLASPPPPPPFPSSFQFSKETHPNPPPSSLALASDSSAPTLPPPPPPPRPTAKPAVDKPRSWRAIFPSRDSSGQKTKGKEAQVVIRYAGDPGCPERSTDPRKDIDAWVHEKGRGNARLRSCFGHLQYEWDSNSPGPPPPAPATAVLVTGLSPLTTADDISRFFSAYGRLESCDVKRDPSVGSALGICWIKFFGQREGKAEPHEVARSVVKKCDGSRVGRAESERIKVVLDGDGSLTKKAVAEELERRHPKPKPKPPPSSSSHAGLSQSLSSSSSISWSGAYGLSPAGGDPYHTARNGRTPLPPPPVSSHDPRPPSIVPSHYSQAPPPPPPPSSYPPRGSVPSSLPLRPTYTTALPAATLLRRPLQPPPYPAEPISSSSFTSDPFASTVSAHATHDHARPWDDRPVIARRDDPDTDHWSPSASDSEMDLDEDENTSASQQQRHPPHAVREPPSLMPTKAKPAAPPLNLQHRDETQRRLAENGKPYVYISASCLPVGKVPVAEVRRHFEQFQLADVMNDSRGWYILFLSPATAQRCKIVFEGTFIRTHRLQLVFESPLMPSPAKQQPAKTAEASQQLKPVNLTPGGTIPSAAAAVSASGAAAPSTLVAAPTITGPLHTASLKGLSFKRRAGAISRKEKAAAAAAIEFEHHHSEDEEHVLPVTSTLSSRRNSVVAGSPPKPNRKLSAVSTGDSKSERSLKKVKTSRPSVTRDFTPESEEESTNETDRQALPPPPPRRLALGDYREGESGRKSSKSQRNLDFTDSDEEEGTATALLSAPTPAPASLPPPQPPMEEEGSPAVAEVLVPGSKATPPVKKRPRLDDVAENTTLRFESSESEDEVSFLAPAPVPKIESGQAAGDMAPVFSKHIVRPKPSTGLEQPPPSSSLIRPSPSAVPEVVKIEESATETFGFTPLSSASKLATKERKPKKEKRSRKDRGRSMSPTADAPLAQDVEDLYFLRLVAEKARRDAAGIVGELDDLYFPSPSAENDEGQSVGSSEPTCLRLEGYAKVTEREKSTYLPQRNKASTAVDVSLTKGQSIASGRSNRVETRRLVQGIEAHKKSSTAAAGGGAADAGDILKFNQLRTRKKQLKFAKSPIHDWGLYAMEAIPANDMVIEYVGDVIRAAVADKREKEYERIGIGSSYLFRIDDDHIVDATVKGNLGRLINHSCQPNCTAKIITINGHRKIVIYAKTLIEAGDEILYDYMFPLEKDKIVCLCGAPKCRGYLN